ncbi:MAG: TetR/AcrR family transcriptional regulator [Betaproteobacteria bacterium]|nr:TetR/AcrR family transcriptional regulator [Betaproteobacteria bacterium]
MTRSPGDVESAVANPQLVEQRREQIINAATRLFSRQGYYGTTLQHIAREAAISVGLIYQYFRDKDDVLFLTLKRVLETYEREIPAALKGVEHPLARLCTAIGAYCRVVDRLRDATVLTYRSTKSLRADRRTFIKQGETRTNRLLEGCLRACIVAGHMHPVNDSLLVYQYVHFSHAWALKQWAHRGRYSLGDYVDEGIKLLVEPYLTDKGRAAMSRLKRKHRRGN